MYSRVGIPAESPQESNVQIHKSEANEAVEIPRRWRCQECGMSVKESSPQPKSRDTIWAVNSKGTGMGLPKPFGAHIIPSQGPDARRRVLMFVLLECGIALVKSFLAILLHLPLEWEYVPCPQLYVGVCNFFFDFTGLTVRVCFESQRRL
jgi:hypothetical protein